MELPQLDNFHQIFCSDLALLDVRAPVEFSQGAFPTARNFPLMNDEERHTVGLCYKKQGHDAAVILGHKLVKDDIKKQRVTDWENFANHYSDGLLYCFRGGLRSKISQQWIYDRTGLVYPRVKGGYKAMRRYLMEQLDDSIQQTDAYVLTGRTGVGKTLLLDKLTQKIDLEKIYHHRGSAFGKHVTPQPSQINVENTLSIQLLKHHALQHTQLLFEDESANIGSRRLPELVIQYLNQAPLILLEKDLQQRVDIIHEEYICQAESEYTQALGKDTGFETWSANLQYALSRIQKRLGGIRFQKIKKLMDFAIDQHRDNQHRQFHKEWIFALLQEYYDPMYDYQLTKKNDRIIFRGDETEIRSYLKQSKSIN